MLQSFWMLVAAFFFAVMSAFVKLSSAETGTFEIVFWRSLISFTVIWGFMLAKGCSPRTNYLTGHLKRSILGTVSFTMWFATMGHLPLGTSTTLNYTAPLFIAVTVIVIALKNREKAPWLLALAIVTGFIGVCLVLQPSVNGEQFKWALLGVGIPAVLAQVCLTRAYAYGNMMLTACFQFATIPIAELIGTFCFGESLPATALTGMALILVAGCAASVITKQMEKNRKKKASSGL